MQYVLYLRDEAVRYRLLADDEVDSEQRGELLGLADVCEDVADCMEQQSTSG